MLLVNLDQTAPTPLYKQIAEQVKQSIATNQLQPGEHLPTVRELARYLDINPGTVVRAYTELEQEQVVVSRRGGGTIVSASSNDPQVLMLRQKRLDNIVSDNILRVLSLGYSPQELEAAFHLYLTRWHEERKSDTAETTGYKVDKANNQNTITIVGSHDLALNLLVELLKHKNPEINIEITHAGSLGGLIALQEERADLAGIHLLDEETREYNYPYVKHIFPGREIAIVNLAYRVQGLMLARNNPKQIKGIEDLKRPDIVFVNRQKGSGTRVLLDLELRQHGIMPSEVNGYEHELDTHMAVAIHIARGKCDVGLGIEAAARACEIDFLPLFHERYDLVMPTAKYHSPLIAPLLEIIATDDFRRLITSIGGYDTAQTGNTSFLN